jgi:hypothetical protein
VQDGARDVGQLPADREAAVSALFVAYHRRLVGLAVLLVDDRQPSGAAYALCHRADHLLHEVRHLHLPDRQAPVAIQPIGKDGCRSRQGFLGNYTWKIIG